MLLLAMMPFVLSACFGGQRLHLGFSKKPDLAHAEKVQDVPFSSVIDFRVQRLSGSRVMLSWHAITGQSGLRFEVFRKIGRDGSYNRIGVVRPDAGSRDIMDYSLTDQNNASDSSYYSIRQVDETGVQYHSLAKGVEGRGR